jgi:hypothetical protein
MTTYRDKTPEEHIRTAIAAALYYDRALGKYRKNVAFARQDADEALARAVAAWDADRQTIEQLRAAQPQDP